MGSKKAQGSTIIMTTAQRGRIHCFFLFISLHKGDFYLLIIRIKCNFSSAFAADTFSLSNSCTFFYMFALASNH